MKAIQVNNVSKNYIDINALKDVTLTFEEGRVYGLLGRNGAGKSTLINIIANRIFPDTGVVTVDELNSRKDNLQEKIFFMSEADYYDKDMKVMDHFKFTDQFYSSFNMSEAISLSDRFNLNTNSKFKNLSRGYKSIFKIVIALSMNLPYIVYDEPIQGLDANHRELFYELLLEDYYKSNRTIILATHLIEEIANVIENVIIIHDGEILVNDTMENLNSKSYSLSGRISTIDEISEGLNVIGKDILGGLKVVYIIGDKPLNINAEVEVSTISLQKLFIHLTSKGGA